MQSLEADRHSTKDWITFHGKQPCIYDTDCAEMVQPNENAGATQKIQASPSSIGCDVLLWDFVNIVLMSK